MKVKHTQKKNSSMLRKLRQKMMKLVPVAIASACFLGAYNDSNAQCIADITAPTGLASGMSYSYYEGSWNSLPDFNSLTPIASGVASGINLNNAVSTDNYGLTFDGFINIPSDGDYTFYTTSDDGSSLSIDGNLVVDNDGLHGSIERSGQICLEAGYHAISVAFFEKTGGEVLSASYSGPGISKTSIPTFYANGVAVPTGNLALNGTALQSSTSHGGSASRAIDGNTNGSYAASSVTHTASGQNQWWQVDLGLTANIGDINVFNRTDNCCKSRLTNFTVSVLDANGNTTFSQTYNTTPDPSLTVNANGVLGRTVRIQLNENNTPLSLTEVEVYGTTASNGCTKTTAFTEAECFDDMSGVATEPSGNTGETNVGSIHEGDWVRYNNLNLSDVNTFSALVGTRRSGASIEIRLDNVSGTQIGILAVPNTGDWHDYVTVSTSISSVSGTHDVFLVFRANSFNIGSFGFTDEDIVLQGDCSDLTSNISLSQNNPGCSNNDGSITITFADSDNQSQIQLSIDGGSSYPVTVNDNSGSYTFTGLSNAEFEVAARYSNNVCEFNIGTLALIQDCGDIPLTPRGVSWHDSYQANGHCWCSTNFDHDLDEEEVTINGRKYNVVDICDELESHPLFRDRADSDEIYNDVQCGNGPINNSSDEPLCPGRVDIGVEGCLETGHHWDMEWLASRSRFGAGFARAGTISSGIENMVFVVPTVATNSITVGGITTGESFEIYSANGVFVSKDIYLGSVNVESLASGVYILKTTSESVRFTKE